MGLAYQFWGIPFNAKKAIEESEKGERLGAFLDGKRGRVGVTVQRLLDNMSLGLWLFQQERVTRKSLQVFIGKEVHTLQFRRPLFSVYDQVWKLISGAEEKPRLDEKVIAETLSHDIHGLEGATGSLCDGIRCVRARWRLCNGPQTQ